MRLSRNRNWGHPNLINFLERLADQGAEDRLARPAGRRHVAAARRPDDHRPRQPSGRPRRRHLAHPDARPRAHPREREEMSATMVVADDRLDVDPKVWTPAHLHVIKAAAQDPQVERIFVNAAIKKALCREAGNDRSWLNKVRPWWGHDYHFHVRLACPADSQGLQAAAAGRRSDGCGKELDYWFTDAILHPKPARPRQAAARASTMATCRRHAARCCGAVIVFRQSAARWCTSPAPARSSTRSRRCLRPSSASA